MEINITTTSSFTTSFIEDTYILFPFTGQYTISYEGNVFHTGIISVPNATLCLSDIAKKFPVNELGVVHPLMESLTVSANGYSTTVTFFNKYSETLPPRQDWFYNGNHYAFTAYDESATEWYASGRVGDEWRYEQINEGDTANFFVKWDDADEIVFDNDSSSESFKLKAVNCVGYAIHYKNQQGGYSTFCLEHKPRVMKDFSRELSVSKKNAQPVQTTIKTSYECHTGAISKEIADSFWVVLASPELYLECPDGSLKRVYCATDNYAESVRTDSPIPHYEFTLVECRDTINYNRYATIH